MSFFLTTFEKPGARHPAGDVCGGLPGKILPIDLSKGDLLCQRDAYLCSADGVTVTLAFTKRFGAGFLGGEGFFLQRLSGDGMAFVHAGGYIVEQELAWGIDPRGYGLPGGLRSVGRLRHPHTGRGIKSMLFGGEGMFFAYMKGPGRV
ncbi:MAG: AIM24 family protein [Planctomycetota bacterium]